MAIQVDRYCMQHIIDILEGKIVLSDEELANVISQMKRKIQIERDRDAGKNLGGRPRKQEEIIDM